MTTRRAACSCGQLSATCTGEPSRAAICHCFACKQKTGSAFGFSAWFREKDVHIEGNVSEWTRAGDEGGRITRRFCPTCGSTVFWTIDQLRGLVAVSAGLFVDLSFPTPTASVYHESRKYPWVEIRTEALEKRG